MFRIALALALFLVIFDALVDTYYRHAPIEWWVDYKSVEIIETPPNTPELVRVWRSVPASAGVIPVTRFTELHETTQSGLVQHCPNVTWTTAEPATNPAVVFQLDQYIGMRCDIRRLEGRRLFLQATYDIELPGGHRKQREFYVGPFVARDGILVHGESNRATVPAGSTAQQTELDGYAPIPPARPELTRPALPQPPPLAPLQAGEAE